MECKMEMKLLSAKISKFIFNFYILILLILISLKVKIVKLNPILPLGYLLNPNNIYVLSLSNFRGLQKYLLIRPEYFLVHQY